MIFVPLSTPHSVICMSGSSTATQFLSFAPDPEAALLFTLCLFHVMFAGPVFIPIFIINMFILLSIISFPSCKFNTVASIAALLLLSCCIDLSMVSTLFIMALSISFRLFRVAFSSARRSSLALAIAVCNFLITLSLGSIV